MLSLEAFRQKRDAFAAQHYKARLAELRAALPEARAQCRYAPSAWMARLKSYRESISRAWRENNVAQAHALKERLYEESKPYAAALRLESEIERLEALLDEVLEKEL